MKGHRLVVLAEQAGDGSGQVVTSPSNRISRAKLAIVLPVKGCTLVTIMRKNLAEIIFAG
jgi:hypothetical protein